MALVGARPRSESAAGRRAFVTIKGVASANARTPGAVRSADPWHDTDVIDQRAARFGQATTGIVALLGAVFGWPLLWALMAMQLLIGLSFGRRWCLPCLAYFTLVQPRFGEGPLEDARPPRLANAIGTAFLGLVAGAGTARKAESKRGRAEVKSEKAQAEQAAAAAALREAIAEREAEMGAAGAAVAQVHTGIESRRMAPKKGDVEVTEIAIAWGFE